MAHTKIIETETGIFIGQRQGETIRVSVPAETENEWALKTAFLDMPLMNQKTFDNFVNAISEMRCLFVGNNKEKNMTFEAFLKMQGIELRPWQKEAARRFLWEVYLHREGRSGKTFLIQKLDEFISEHGNDFMVY